MTEPTANSETRPYWEPPEPERRALSAARLIDEDEYFVLSKINHGRRMMRTEVEGSEGFFSANLEPEIEDVADCNYYDAIASLLFAAVKDGFDPRELCADALDQYQSFSETAGEGGRALRGGGEPEQGPVVL